MNLGSDGLGFTVTSKDVLTSQTRDFFIKSILNKGAAIKDGRIKAGDQLLKVCFCHRFTFNAFHANYLFLYPL